MQTEPNPQKSQLTQQIQQMEEEYNNYIDSSDVILEYYKNQQVSGLDKHFLKIEEWFDSNRTGEQNTPLVIEADDGVGKKTLLVKWINYHNANKKGKYPDIIIPHFATIGGNNGNYFYAIYRILIKLRELLNIEQKVELLEEKLRKYFSYWLDVCNTQLERQLIKDTKTTYDKIILIFEGINHFVDQGSNNKEANVAFWLPQYFPDRIKVIVTASKNSEAMLYFNKQLIPQINIQNEQSIIKRMIDVHKNRKSFLSDNLKEKLINVLQQYPLELMNSSTFCKTYLSLLIPYPSEGLISEHDVNKEEIEKIVKQVDVEKLQSVKNIEELIDYILEVYSTKIVKDKLKFQKMLLSFAITQKGISQDEVLLVCKLEQSDWLMFLAFFKVYLMRFKNYWIINNDLFKGILLKKYQQNIKFRQSLHEEIADCLHKTPNSIRKLEEQTYNLFMGKAYFKLKEIISTIENFLLLFNPNNKYDLCRYWQKLEEQGFDPVIEYNKAIEGFQMQFHPTSEDIFRIIVQVSRFLKEFGDFETYFTPKFRHPPIQGILEELDDIGLLHELSRMDIYFLADPNKKDKLNNDIVVTPQQKILEKLKQIQEKKEPKKSVSTKFKTEPTPNKDKSKKPAKLQILNEIESLNVDISYNRDEVKKFYEDQIGFNAVTEDVAKEQQSEILMENQSSMLMIREDDGPRVLQLQKPNFQKHQPIQLQEQFEVKERTPTDYYYKRWIWIQFPWACLSLNSDYSAKMKQCFAKPTQYMSVQEEMAFTRQALKIAIEAKLKKKMMLQKPEERHHTTMRGFQDNSTKQDNNNSLMSLFRSSSNLQHKNSEGSIMKSQQMKQTTRHQNSLGFFITEDYQDTNYLQKEVEQLMKTGKLPDLKRDADEMNSTIKILDRSRQNKLKSKPFVSNLNTSQSVSILPRLKNQINSHSGKEISLMLQQANSMQKEYDNLVYQNSQLAKKLQQLKTLKANEGISDQGDDLSLILQNNDLLEKSVKKAEYDFQICLIQKDRLKIIIKICSDNKSYNEEWIRDLNYLLSNLNKLIKYEQVSIDQLNNKIDTLKQTHIEYVEVFNKNLNYNKQVVKHINKTMKDKEELDNFFQQSDTQIEKKSLMKIKKMERQQLLQQQQEQEIQKRIALEKNSQSIMNKLEDLKEQLKKISECFDITNPLYNEGEKFVVFQHNLEIKQQLIAKIYQLSDRQDSLSYHLQLEKTYLETVQNAQANDQSKKKREATIKFLRGRIQENETLQGVKEKKEQIEKDILEKVKKLQKLNAMKMDFDIMRRNLEGKMIQFTNNQEPLTIQQVSNIMIKKQQQIKEQLDKSTATQISQIREQLTTEKDGQCVVDQKQLRERSKQIQQKHGYQGFLDGTFDYATIYRSAYQYYQDPDMLDKQME